MKFFLSKCSLVILVNFLDLSNEQISNPPQKVLPLFGRESPNGNFVNAGLSTGSFVPVDVKNGSHQGSVSSDNGVQLLLFHFKESSRKESVIRVSAEVHKEDGGLVTFFFSQTNNNSFSRKLPYTSELDGTTFWTASKSLCQDTYSEGQDDKMLVLVSTTHPTSIRYNVRVSVANVTTLGPGEEKQQTIVPNHPEMIFLHFESQHRLLMRITSGDTQCAIVSVQGTSCPISDEDTTVFSEGYWSTMTTKSGMTLKSSDFPNGGLIVFLVLNDTSYCSNSTFAEPWHNYSSSLAIHNLLRNVEPGILTKTINITFKEDITNVQRHIAIFVPLGILIAAIFILGVVWTSRFGRTYRGQAMRIQLDEHAPNENQQDSLSVPQPVPSTSSGVSSGHNLEYTVDTETKADDSDNGHNDIDDDNSDDQSVLLESSQSNQPITTSRTFENEVDQRGPIRTNCIENNDQNLNFSFYSGRAGSYAFMVAICFFYYVVPVFQMVVKYQFKLYESGNLDLCYYNYWCAHPLWVFNDFNHVYSNLAYVLLGMLFLFVTYVREKDYRRLVECFKDYEKRFGIPAHFGFFYAMGIGLMMEGILSGFYHVCPSQANFQIDTFFMYVNAALCLVKLYHGRHPQNFSFIKYIVFLMLPLISLLVPIFGFIGNLRTFWATVGVLHFIGIFGLVVYRVYKAEEKPRYIGIVGEPLETVGERTLDLCITYSLILFLNLGLAIAGPVTSPADCATYILGAYLANLLLYLIVYLAKKVVYKEMVILKSFTCWSLLALVFWGVSGAFFLQPTTSWEVSPAEARTWNEECIVFGFYDNHDVWHFFSAFAMFFSFMALLTIDDDIILTERDRIRVF